MQGKPMANKQTPLFGLGHRDYSISSFSVAVTKFLDQKQLKKGFVLAYGSKGIESSWWGRCGLAAGAGNWLIKFYPRIGMRE